MLPKRKRQHCAVLLLYAFGIEALVPPAILRAPAAAIAVLAATSSRAVEQPLSACDAALMGRSAPTAGIGVARLWPANHSFQNIGFTASVGLACSGIASLGIQVWSDEPEEDQTGDGNHQPDARVVSGPALELRSERKGDADGRVYLIIARAESPSGASNSACVTVGVPKSQAKQHREALDAQLGAASFHCAAHDTPPPGFFPILDAPWGAPSNQPPQVSAGPDLSASFGATAALEGSGSDDGLPLGQLTFQWSVISGPETVAFGDDAVAATTATFSAAGSYVLRLTASDGALQSSDDVSVVVGALNLAPVVSAGPDLSVTLPLNSVTLLGTASDDGLPTASLTISWEMVSGPGTVTFASPASATTLATFGAQGTYLLRLTATDGSLASSDDVQVIVNQPENAPPSVSAGPDQSLPTGTMAATLLGTVSDDGQPGGVLTSEWTQVSGPASATIVSPSASSTGVNFSQEGVYVFKLTATDGVLSASDDVSVTVNVPANQAPVAFSGDDIEIEQPETGGVVSGSGTDDGLPSGVLTFAWTQVLGPDVVVFADPLAQTTAFTAPTIGTYVLRLTVSDGALTATDDLAVVVRPEPPPSVSIDDLTLTEGNAGRYAAQTIVRLSRASATEVSVAYVTSPGTTAAGCDYETAFGFLLFPPGVTELPVEIFVNGDLVVEEAETIEIRLGNPAGATIADSSALVTIVDDDVANAPPVRPSGRAPVQGLTEAPLSTALNWAVSADPQGDPVTYDVQFGTAFEMSGQRWQSVCSVTTGPSARTAPASAYDDARDRLFVFGGSTGVIDLGDMWVLKNATQTGGPSAWEQIQAPGGPGPRRHARAVYDASADRVIVVGGCAGACESGSAETWALVGASTAFPTWQPLAGLPEGRAAHALAFDEANARLFAFGGLVLGERTNSLLRIDLNEASPAWTTVPTSGAAPEPSFGAAAIYDPASDVLVVHGGRTEAGATARLASLSFASTPAPMWSQTTPEGPAPAGRYGHGLHYDSFTDRAVLFGGTTSGIEEDTNFVASDAWVLEHARTQTPAWSKVQAQNPPTGRFDAATAYSTSENRLVVALGANNKIGIPALSDTDVLEDAAGRLETVSSDQSATELAPAIDQDHTYFWRVTARDSRGARAGGRAQAFSTGLPSLTVNDVAVAEGDNPPSQATLTLVLSRPATDGAQVFVETADLSAVSGLDYMALGQLVIFPPGASSAQVSLPIIPDEVLEADETFRVILSAPQGVRLADAEAEVVITNDDAANQAPLVDAGVDQSLVGPRAGPIPIALAGQATDDGLPSGSTLALEWSLVSGPGAVAFASPSEAATQATVSVTGEYVFRLQANDGELESSDTVAFQVTRNAPPTVSAGADRVVETGATVAFVGAATDDGALTALQYEWSLVSGPAPVSFAAPQSLSTSAQFGVTGTYIVRFSAFDGDATSADEATVLVTSLNQPPVVDAGADQNVARPQNLVQNPGNEQPLVGGNIPFWTEVAGVSWGKAPAGTGSYPAAYEGVTYFYPGASGNAELRQDVDLSSLAAATDAGSQRILTEARVRTFSPDLARVVFEFLDQSATVLATQDSGNISSPAEWRLVRHVIEAPPLTRTVRIRLIGVAGSGSTDAYFDAIRVTALGGDGFVAALQGVATDDGLPLPANLITSWSQVSGPAPAIVSNPASLNSEVRLPTAGTYVFSLQASDGSLISADAVTLQTSVVNQAPLVDAGRDQIQEIPAEAAGGFNLLLNPSADLPLVAGRIPFWTYEGGAWVLGPAGVTFPAPFEGSNYFYPGTGPFGALRQLVDVAALSTAIDASTQEFEFRARIRTFDLVDKAQIVLEYQDEAGALLDTVIFPAQTSPGAWTLLTDRRLAPPGTRRIQVRLVAIGVAGDSNDAYFDALSLVAVGSLPISLSGRAEDDGLPAPLTTSWTAPAGVTLSSVSSLSTIAMAGEGSHLFSLTASDTALSDTDRVTVTVQAPARKPFVDAEANRNVGPAVTQTTIQGALIDDLRPSSAVVTWSQVSGPAPSAISTPNNLASLVTLPAAGAYVFRLTATDSLGSSHDDVRITRDGVNSPPVVDAGLDLVVASYQTSADASVNDDGLPIGAALALTWSQLSGPGPVSFSSSFTEDPQISFPTPGVYTLRLLATDSASSVSDDVTFTVAPETLLPDLAVASVSAATATFDSSTLAISGLVSASVSNLGDAPSAAAVATAFEDRDGNGLLGPGDTVLGTAPVGAIAPGGALPLSFSVSGILSFAGALIHLSLDAAQEVAEIREDNNVSSSAPSCVATPLPVSFSPALKWSFTGPGRQTAAMPIVADLDADRVPEILVSSYGGGFASVLSVLNSDGTLRFAHNNLINDSTAPAVADIDGDGLGEIVMVSLASRLVALEHDGLLKWTSPSIESTGYGSPAIADLDGDGRPEIVVGRQVLNADGTLRWTGTGGKGTTYGGLSIVADLDMDGSPEVIAGNTAYRANGAIYWQRSTLVDGYNAVGNFDADPLPEVVLVGNGVVTLLEHDGTTIWSVAHPGVSGATFGGPPLVADVTGDGIPEIGVAAANRYAVFRSTGAVLWQGLTNDASSHKTGSTAFDFNGDGLAEIVYADERRLRVYAGDTGTVLYSRIVGSTTAVEAPVVADIDSDGHADILVGGDVNGTIEGQPAVAGLYVLSDSNNRWPPTRGLFNQHAYHVDNIGDDLSVPRRGYTPWTSHNSFRRNFLVEGCVYALPDLTAAFARKTAIPSGTRVTVRVGNGGGNPVGAGSRVSFHGAMPPTPANLLGVAFTSAVLPAGAFVDVSVDLPSGTQALPLVVRVDDAERDTESNELNNIFETGLYLTATPNAAPVADAGLDQIFSLPQADTTLVGAVSDDGLPTSSVITMWTQSGGPAPVAIAAPTSLSTAVTFPLPGVYTLRLSAFDLDLTTFDEVEVVVTPANTAPTVDLGADRTVELPQGDLSLTAVVTDDDLPLGSSLTLAWSQTSGPAPVTFASPSSPSTSATFTTPGVYTLRLTAFDTALTAFDEVQVTVFPPNDAPVIDAGPDQTLVHPANSASLVATLSDDGLPVGSSLAVSWTQVSGPATAVFAAPSSAATPVTLPVIGTYVLRVTANDGAESAFDDITIHRDPQNTAPSVNAGPDSAVTTATTTLGGMVADDGFPRGSVLGVTWAQVSGPGLAVLHSPTLSSTSVTFPGDGVYVFQLTASDTALSGSDTVAITVSGTNLPPTVDAGSDATVFDSVLLSGAIGDDDRPVGAALLSTWSFLSGPVPVTIPAPAALETTVPFSAAGVYTFRLTAFDGALAAFDDVTVTVTGGNQAPVVNAGADATLSLPSLSLALAGSVTDDGLPNGSAVSVSWSHVSGPLGVAFQDPTSATTQTTFPGTGVYVLRLSATDTQTTAFDDVTVTIGAAAPVGGAPTIAITSPGDSASITSPTEIIGSIQSAQLLDWKLEIKEGSETAYRTIATGNKPVANAAITSFDPTMLLNGLYDFRFVARDTALRTTTVARTAVIRDNLKVGQFSVSFVDLEVPVAGLPIRVTRTYDSRDKGKWDFGFGWRLDLSNVTVRENSVLATGFTGSITPGFFPTYCLQATKPQVVTVTLPGGELLEFEPRIAPSCQPFAPIAVASISYVPRPGSTTQGTLRPASGNNTVLVSGSSGPVQLFDEATYSLFDPNEYILTLPDGRELTVHQTTGLKRIKDLNGNTLNVTSGGITHSSGRGIAFARDAQGRITSVTDPAGNVQAYAYDAAGDLTAHTDRENNVTTFTYLATPAHHLEEIHDALGRTPIRNEYYPDGRIQRHTDAYGKTIEYAHDVTGRQEVVTDREGGVRVLHYDGRGNVTKEVQPDGRQILRTFDGRNNRTSETEPHEPTNLTPATTSWTYDAADNVTSTTDPLNNTTTQTYNARRQILTSTDARGKTTTNVYDVKGNLTSTTDAYGHVTTFTYDAKGNLLTQSQTVNGVVETTTNTYDTFGNLLTETDALGRVTTSTYDTQGNRKTETRTRTLPGGTTEALTTTYVYDKNGRLTKSTDADGTFTETVYDAAGRQTSTKDKLGRVTTFEYDFMGRLTKTTYPDTTFEESTYDGEGRRLTSKDRAGRITSYEYDALGRMRKTIYADATFTESFYDVPGRLESTKDARGKITSYQYDSAGRRTKVFDPLNHETVFTYDANGNQKTVKDANNNTTTYEYDDLNRRTKTIFPDATFTETAYDEAGRRISEKDQAGKITQFQYDKLGRLVSVIPAQAGIQPTTYTYDEVGNRLTQTDANNRTTSFEYDKLGREVARILPDGARETKTYDTLGNLATRTDFLGRVTTYAYDINNRPTSRTAACTSCEKADASWTYTLTGRRATATYQIPGATPATPETITETYAYDNRDRLSSVIATVGAPATQRSNLAYTYDANGNRETLTSTVGAAVTTATYAYDDASRLDTVTDTLGRVYDLGYDAVGNRTSLAHPNGVETAYGYNTLNRLTSLTTQNGATTIQSYAFTLGPSGNRTQITEADKTKTYTYDDLYRLTGETLRGSTVYSKVFVYDPVGNRQTQMTTGSAGVIVTPGTINYGYDTRDRLLTENATTYGYDANGNFTTQSGFGTYTFDTENRLVRIAKSDGTLIEHAYDADGTRIRIETTPPAATKQTTNFVVDTSGGLSHVVAEFDAAGIQANYYLRALDDLLAVTRPTTTPGVFATRYYHADGIGSIRKLTDDTGAVTDSYEYTAFGEQYEHVGTDPQPYSFAGEPLDPNSGFQYHRARWMQPSTGRFAGMDPFAGSLDDPQSLHRYIYVSGTPVNGVDPTGMLGSFEFGTSISISGILDAAASLSLSSLIGAVAGAGDAYFRGDDVLAAAKEGGLIGFVTGPVLTIRFIRPVVVAFGTIVGVMGVVEAVELGNPGLAAYRGSLTLLGGVLFNRKDSPVLLPTNPNTGGAGTRVQLLGLAFELQRRGWKITGGGAMLPEEWVANSTAARRKGNFVDLTATKDGKTVRIQTIDTLADGMTPSGREAANAALIRANTPRNDHLILVPKIK